MSVQVDHEHWFFSHEDPRWLICDCGQYAVRTRNITGDRVIKLIDVPQPVVRVPERISLPAQCAETQSIAV
jgi:hypothetical protein